MHSCQTGELRICLLSKKNTCCLTAHRSNLLRVCFYQHYRCFHPHFHKYPLDILYALFECYKQVNATFTSCFLGKDVTKLNLSFRFLEGKVQKKKSLQETFREIKSHQEVRCKNKALARVGILPFPGSAPQIHPKYQPVSPPRPCSVCTG